MHKRSLNKIFTIIICVISLISCSSRKLSVPDFKTIQSITMVYTTDENTYTSNESIYSDTPIHSYYEYLSKAKYVKKMNENNMIDSPNIMIVIILNDQSKIAYTIYQENNKTYLEDTNNLELYTINNEVFETISNDFEINHSMN